MAVHDHEAPADREAFLVDGCARCAEYERDLGLHFDAARWRAFWGHMVDVEFGDGGRYASKLDASLGRKLYYVALSLQRAYGFSTALLRFPASLACAENLAVHLTPREVDEGREESITPEARAAVERLLAPKRPIDLLALRRACGYRETDDDYPEHDDDEYDDSYDSLVAYKDALEDLVHRLADEPAPTGDDPIRFVLDGLGVSDLGELRRLVDAGRAR